MSSLVEGLGPLRSGLGSLPGNSPVGGAWGELGQGASSSKGGPPTGPNNMRTASVSGAGRGLPKELLLEGKE